MCEKYERANNASKHMQRDQRKEKFCECAFACVICVCLCEWREHCAFQGESTACRRKRDATSLLMVVVSVVQICVAYHLTFA